MTASEPHADATQRMRIPQDGSARDHAPVRRTQPRTSQQQHTTSNRRPPQKRRRRMAKKDRNLVIILSSVALVLLIAIIVTCFVTCSGPKDDGLILPNVYVAGVDLSGMTEEEAVQAVRQSVGNAYSETDMVITVLEDSYTLSPSKSKAKLDVEAAVKAAYQYGRTGSRADRDKAKQQAMEKGYHVPLVNYLNLDAAYVNSFLQDIGNKYGTILKQPEVTITGERPAMEGVYHPDTTVVHQTLTIRIGTPEYGLNMSDLTDQVMGAFDRKVFAVTVECSLSEPRRPDVDALYAEHCTAPVDANLDENFETTPEIYGYGFDLETVKQQVAEAEYGAVLEIQLCFIKPAITAEEISGDLFKDVLGQAITALPEDPATLANLQQAVKALNAKLIKAGDEFSFNKLIGEPTVRTGYHEAMANIGREFKEVYGGGISQVASTMYISALLADLPIVERHPHYYAPEFVDPGLDADILYGSRDLKFTNHYEKPIRIEAVIEGETLKIILWGTENRDYAVRISYETVHTYTPSVLVQTITQENPAGFENGDVILEPITGYDVITYKTYIPNDTTIQPTEDIEAGQSHYEKRNKVIAQIEEPPEPTVPTTPPTSSTPESSVPGTSIPDSSTTQPTVPDASTTNPTVPGTSTTQPTVPETSTTQPTVPETSTVTNEP